MLGKGGQTQSALRSSSVARRSLTCSLTSARQRTQTSFRYDDLPLTATGNDGSATQPLPSLEKGSRPSRRRKGPKDASKSCADGHETEDVSTSAPLSVDRIDELGPEGQTWPPLAKDVLANMTRFPDCILLTRVGGFYESYFEQAPILANMTGVKLTRRTFGGRTIAMAGFPLAQLEKYLKILVQDHGKLVALCEEFKVAALPKTRRRSTKKEEQDDDEPTELQLNALPQVDISRRVTRVVSRGTLIDEKFLDPFISNWVLAVSGDAAGRFGLAWLDVGTADFDTMTCFDIESLRDEVARIGPREIVLQSDLFNRPSKSAHSSTPSYDGQVVEPNDSPFWEAINREDTHVCLTPSLGEGRSVYEDADPETLAVKNLTEHLRARLMDSMPSELDILSFHQEQEAGQGAESASRSSLLPLQFGRQRRETETMHIDAHTLLALEVRASSTGGTSGSLLSTMKRTVTKGGSRLLSEWLTAPSTLLPVIHRRQSLVELFVQQGFLRQDLRTWLRRGIGDVSRALQRITTGRNDEQDLLEVRDFVATCNTLVGLFRDDIERQDKEVEDEGWKALRTLLDRFHSLEALGARLGEAIDEAVIEKRSRDQEELARQRHEEVLENVTMEAIRRDGGLEEPRSSSSSKTKSSAKRKQVKDDQGDQSRDIWGVAFEHMIRPNASKELKSLTKEHVALRRRAARFEQDLRQKMNTEKLTLRNVPKQGFVVHVQDGGPLKSKSDVEELEKMYMSAQGKTYRTYLHPEWTTLGRKLEHVERQLLEREATELQRLRHEVLLEAKALRRNARLVDEVDILTSFAQLAVERRLVRPIVDDSGVLEVKGCRHLAVEAGLLAHGRSFTPNDVEMHPNRHRLHLVTGPNMGGKSTFLRQVATLCLVAQTGCFVPCESARIGLVDGLFSRVGARDDVARDRSTFMVEMAETSEILKRATKRSLVIADEIGRGTTTDVGVSIASATLRTLLAKNGCRTLFATHLHEIADLLLKADSEFGRNSEEVKFVCTDVEEDESDGSIIFSHRLREGINRESHGLKVAKLAGMPEEALAMAEETLGLLREVRQPLHL